ncbi:hypothetical protein GGX14DRAFT_579894 [Mycena pura]|uniref:Uncharacterized protein n=1 Tax=Mycena pura TaxID=153505 RepID=A0AAD6UMG0_9AGAR|nr:hypothetical protein GGX14DRAFT_579894 [Mycena pura]
MFLAGLAGLRRDANLHDLSFAQLSTFTRLLSLLKNDILLCQPHNISTDAPPSFLPPTVRLFASGALGVPADAVPKLWDALKDDVWALCDTTLSATEENLFREHGWKLGLMPMTCP